jgi:hypothetical protein
LISLQKAYNLCVKNRDELARELETLKKLYDAKMQEADRRAARLETLVKRAEKNGLTRTTRAKVNK